MKEEWTKYDPTGKLFPKEEGQSTVPILIEFPVDFYAQSRNSYYKKLRTTIKILGLLILLILISWMSIIVYLNYAPTLTSAEDTPLNTFQNVDSKSQLSSEFHDSPTSHDSYTKDQTVTSTIMTMKKLDGQKSVPELLRIEKSKITNDKESSEKINSEYIDTDSDDSDTEDRSLTTLQMSSTEAGVDDKSIEESAENKDNVSINKPDVVENKFMKKLEEVWTKALNVAENKDEKNLNKAPAYDDIESENKTVRELTETQENFNTSVQSSVKNVTAESKSDVTNEDESSEENYSDYIDEDSDESDTEDRLLTTLQMSSTEAGVDDKRIEESAENKDNVSINKPDVVENKFMKKLEEVWTKALNDAENKDEKNLNKAPADDDIESENKTVPEFTETQENFNTSLQSAVKNVSAQSKSDVTNEDESSEENYSDYIDEDSDESDTEDRSLTTLHMSSTEAGVDDKSIEESAENKDNVSINKPDVVENKFMKKLEEVWTKALNVAENKDEKNLNKAPAYDDIESENKTVRELTETQENFNTSVQSSVKNVTAESKSDVTNEDESSEENYSDYIDEDSDESDTEDRLLTTLQMSSTEAGVDDKRIEESAENKDNVSINKPDVVENKFMKKLEEVWTKALNDAENKDEKNLNKAPADDDIESENKTVPEFTETQENFNTSLQSAVKNVSAQSKSDVTKEDESSEENYSDYIDEDSDESDTEDRSLTTLHMSSTEAGVDDKSIEESAEDTDNTSIQKPDVVENKFMKKLEEVWTKALNVAENKDEKNLNKAPAYDDIESENKTVRELTETQENFNTSVQSSVKNVTAESKSDVTNEDESSEENYSDYIDEDSDESDTEDRLLTTLQMSSTEAGVDDKRIEESAENKDNVSINKPDVVENKFMKKLEEVWTKVLNDTENKDEKNLNKAPADDDIESENKTVPEFTETQENFNTSLQSAVKNVSAQSKSDVTKEDESLEEIYPLMRLMGLRKLR